MSQQSSDFSKDLAQEMSIEDYLRAAVQFDVPDNALLRILIKRGICQGDLVSCLEEKQKDLATADLYMWCAMSPSSKDYVKDTDGDWSHQEGGFSMSATDKRHLREAARLLYKKWDEESALGSSLRLVNL